LKSKKFTDKQMSLRKLFFFLFLFFLPHKIFSVELNNNKVDPSQDDSCLHLLRVRFFINSDYSHFKLINFLSNSPKHTETNQGFSFGPIHSLPIQGWKIHISFPIEHAFTVIEKIAPILFNEFPNIAFKIPDTLAFERAFGNKENSQYGKLITIYPKNTLEFQKVNAALKPALEEIERQHGSFIQPNAKGDISMQTPGLFARYGRFTPSSNLSDNEIIRVNKDGNALNKNNQLIQFNGKTVNLIDLNQHLRPLSKEEKEEMNETFNHLRAEGALEKDDRNLTPLWAKKLIQDSSL
jgi:hypothetical protein